MILVTYEGILSSFVDLFNGYTNEKIVYLKSNENSKLIIIKATSCYPNENSEHRRI